MATEHDAILDPEIHEPKGVAAASSGEAYIADGAGSGAWTNVPVAQAACLQIVSAVDTTGMTTAFQVINEATLGGTITASENQSLNMTTDLTGAYITVQDTGVYKLIFTANIEPATNGSVFVFTFGVDSGSGVVTKEAFVNCEVRTSGVTDTFIVAFNCLPSLVAADKVYIAVKETSAGEEFELVASNFTIERVG